MKAALLCREEEMSDLRMREWVSILLNSAIEGAAESGHVKLMYWLLEMGASLDSAAKSVARHNQERIAYELLVMGASRSEAIQQAEPWFHQYPWLERLRTATLWDFLKQLKLTTPSALQQFTVERPGLHWETQWPVLIADASLKAVWGDAWFRRIPKLESVEAVVREVSVEAAVAGSAAASAGAGMARESAAEKEISPLKSEREKSRTAGDSDSSSTLSLRFFRGSMGAQDKQSVWPDAVLAYVESVIGPEQARSRPVAVTIPVSTTGIMSVHTHSSDEVASSASLDEDATEASLTAPLLKYSF